MNSFRFVSYAFDEPTSELSLRYAFDEQYFLEEKIIFHQANTNLTKEEKQAVEQICFFLHIACGISYYKAFLPPKLKIESGILNREQAAFFEEFYLKGLGEFAWRNGLNLGGRIHFPFADSGSYETPLLLPLKQRIAIPVGGGKDSNVVIESLKKSGQELVAIAQGRPRPIKECIEISGLKDINFTRIISPVLLDLNTQAGTYNGHVPISGIYAFCLALGAVLYGYNRVAMGNERSANVGNIIKTDGFEVNHQWSKSLAFEELFSNFNQKYMLQNFSYFSLLRPLSELDIARRFAQLTQYHKVFTSCNKAFKIDKEKRLDRWCGNCDKCRFVFLALAPFMEKQSLIRAVGHNLLDDTAQENGFRELLGLQNHKPFECVGEVEECCVALVMLANLPCWQDDYIVKQIYPEVLAKYGQGQLHQWHKEVFTPSSRHHVPADLEGCLICC